MALTGSINNIYEAANIDVGRKGLANRGNTEEGLVSFHHACISHKTRLKNILRSPGINLIEKALLRQRLSNLSTAQSGYIEKQKKALEG